MKQLSLFTLQFYNIIKTYNIAFTILAILLVVFNSSPITIPVFLFAKIMGFIAAVALHYFSAKENYFYFRNAGFDMKQILISAFVIDISFCLALITVFKILLHVATHFKN